MAPTNLGSDRPTPATSCVLSSVLLPAPWESCQCQTAFRRSSGQTAAGQLLPVHTPVSISQMKQENRATALPCISGGDDCSNQDGRTAWSPAQLWIRSEVCSHPTSPLLHLLNLPDAGSWARQARRVRLFIKDSSRSPQFCLLRCASCCAC